MATTDAKIVFTPSGRRGRFPLDTPVLEAARSLGVDVDSVCGGRGLCGRCQVTCAEGEFAKHEIISRSSHLSSVGDVETLYGERRKPLQQGRRLSCQARIRGDLVIDVPAESQMHRQVVRKSAEYRDITLDTSVHLYYVEVQEASLDDPTADLQRLLLALANEWQLQDLDFDAAILEGLQPTLRDGDWKVTVAVHKQSRVVAVWPGFKRDAYGVAIDIGSTTVAAHLCNLTTGDVVATGGIMNPQIRFGEDLMSRVSYVMMHPEGSDELTESVRAGVNELIAGVVSDAGIESGDILEATIVGNPIMHHLFLGINPVELGWAPFALATDRALDLQARELGLEINAGGVAYVLPCIAGHVGADAAAMILSEEPHLLEETSLVVDVGTNAEIVLGNRDRLLACSSPTGPAFEGAQISCGQRAAPGAIERVRVDTETFDVRFSVIGSELWSDEPGFADSIKKFGVTGICGSGIIEAVAEMYLAGVVSRDGVIDGDMAKQTPRLIADERTWSFVVHDGNPKISVTQNYVRQIQLAKAALYAGVKLLMDRAGLERVDRIRLAGAFGSHIDPRYAMILGLIPDCDLDNVESAGNAAGTGARIALLNRAARGEIESVVRNIEKIETAVEPNFQEYFVDAMAIPNGRDPYPILFSVVDRPDGETVRTDNKPRRRRRAKRAS
ncbi:MAG: ASKHA domain-containing protein [Woeseiaceae bacterium]